MAKEYTEDREQVIHNLLYCASALRGHSDGKVSQRRVLLTLRQRGTMTQRELLEEMGVRPASLSELLSKLEGRGLIRKERSETDRRNYEIQLTEEGQLALEDMQAKRRAMPDLLEGLTQEEVEQLAALLDKLRTQWQNRTDLPSPHPHGHHRGHSHLP